MNQFIVPCWMVATAQALELVIPGDAATDM